MKENVVRVMRNSDRIIIIIFNVGNKILNVIGA